LVWDDSSLVGLCTQLRFMPFFLTPRHRLRVFDQLNMTSSSAVAERPHDACSNGSLWG